MGNSQSQQNEFCNVCINHAGNEVIVTIYEDKSFAYLRKKVKNECDFGDAEFALFVLLGENRENIVSDEDVVELLEGRLLGSRSNAPTIFVEIVGGATALANPLTPPKTNSASPIAGQETLTLPAIPQFPTGESFDVMLSYQWDSKYKVERIYDDLVASGLTVWMDLDQMHGDIYRRMVEGVVASKIFSPCLTLAYSKSDKCLAEIEYARVVRKAMVPNLFWKPAVDAPLHQTFVELKQVDLITAGLLLVDFHKVEPDQAGWADCMSDLKAQIAKRLSEVNSLAVNPASPTTDQLQSTVPMPQQSTKPDILREWLKPVDIDSDLNSYAESYVSGTRHWLLEKINAWIADPGASQVMWLRGGAGVGKSMMAWFVGAYLSHSLSKHVEDSLEIDQPVEALLGARFFCKYNDSLKNDPHCVIQSIAYQLSFIDSRIQIYLSELCSKDLEKKPSLIDSDIVTKFDKLVLEPLRQIDAQQGTTRKIVVILDALDECGKIGGKAQKELLLAFANSINKTPKNVKLLVTGRPEPGVYSVLHDMHCTELCLTDDDNLKDTKIYAHERLKIYLGTNKKLLDEAIGYLSAAAEGVFVWMRLVCDLIRSKSPQTEDEAMSIISAQGRGVDSAYHQLLESALLNTGGSAENFRRVFGMLCVVKVPVTLNVLAELLNMEETLVSAELLRYRFLIEIMASGAVKFIHKSVSDFLTNSSRCSDSRFSIILSIYETVILDRCLDIMMSGLFANIGDLSSTTIYEKIPPSALEKIPNTLLYCCLYWIEHFLWVSDISSDGFSKIYSFCKTDLLSWAEVMIINQAIRTMIGQLEKFSLKIAMANKMTDAISVITVPEAGRADNRIPILRATAAKFIEDISVDLARVVEYNLFPISKCPLQLYCTGLVFCPTKTKLWETYKDILSGPFSSVKFTIGRELSWSPQLWNHQLSDDCHFVTYSPDGSMIAAATGNDIIILDVQYHTVLIKLKGHSDSVKSVAWSHDGTKIVSGSYDFSVRVWSATTGEQLMKLEGHSSWVYSVAWSHDGTKIVSGSQEQTVRVWSATTGEQLMTLEGHSSWVNSVAWSHDGTKIVSGSFDSTVRVWSATTGEQLMMLEVRNSLGYSSVVSSVAWSHDGTKIVSGSSDETVRVWSATTGEQLIELEGHRDWVNSVVWSRDGTKIVSGSDDSTVNVWSATTGEQLLKLEGHSTSVISVAWSHDGTKIVSGSSDKTVRVWSATTGEHLMKLEGRGSGVISVAWSHDGTKIVSGSVDNTVGVWSPTTGEQLMKLEGHSYAVYSVAWSHDGTKIVSGSFDKTVRVWSATTGEQLMKLEGHISSVYSVAWSHDGTKIVSKSGKGEMILWSAVTGQKVDGESLSEKYDDGYGTYYFFSQVYSDGWAVLGHHKFWLPAEMRGIIYNNSEKGMCVIQSAKMYCFLK